MGIESFFKEENDQIIFLGNYMEVYLPKYYFDKGISKFSGSKIETLGIFAFKVFSDETKKKNVAIHYYLFPSFFTTCPTFNETKVVNDIPTADNDFDIYDKDEEELENTEKVKTNIENNDRDENSEEENPEEIEEKPNDEERDEPSSNNKDKKKYMVLSYYKNDIFIENLNSIQKSDNTELFVKLLNSGKLPPFIPYEKIFKMELDNCNFNGVSLGVPAVTMEMVISEIYRSKNDLSKPFRFAIGKNPKLSQLDYKAINIKQIPSFSSTFASVTFEDINYSLVSSINRTKYEKEETYSPIEETIKY